MLIFLQDGEVDAEELQRCLTQSGISGTYARETMCCFVFPSSLHRGLEIEIYSQHFNPTPKIINIINSTSIYQVWRIISFFCTWYHRNNCSCTLLTLTTQQRHRLNGRKWRFSKFPSRPSFYHSTVAALWLSVDVLQWKMSILLSSDLKPLHPSTWKLCPLALLTDYDNLGTIVSTYLSLLSTYRLWLCLVSFLCSLLFFPEFTVASGWEGSSKETAEMAAPLREDFYCG